MSYAWTDVRESGVSVKEVKMARIEAIKIPSSAEVNKWYDFALSVHVDSGTFKPVCAVHNLSGNPGSIKIKTNDGKEHNIPPGNMLVSVSPNEMSPCHSFGILGAKILFTKPGDYRIRLYAGYPR